MLAPRASMPAASESMMLSRRPRVLRGGQAPGGPQRVDARAEQRLVGVDVPHPGDLALVEQERLDRRDVRPRASPRRCSAVNRSSSGSSPRRAAKNASSASCAEQQLAGAEAARVDDHQRGVPGPRSRRTRMCGGSGSGSQQHRAGHAQVLERGGRRPRRLHTRYLPRLPSRSTRPPLERVGQLPRRERPRPARVEDLDALQPAPLHQRRELAPDRLDLGQLGHRPSL